MAALDSVRQKFYRAQEHWEELNRRLVTYYGTDPGELVEIAESTPDKRLYVFKEKSPLPAHIGLICGDCLQCLRSSLDYLVWELVLASKIKLPGRNNMFPISLNEKDYKSALVKQLRLDGVDPKAITIIDSLQPYLLAKPEESPLALLDALTNLNKHRRVIFSNLAACEVEPPIPFPCLMGTMRTVLPDGEFVSERQLWGFVTIQDGAVKDIEITMFLNTLARYLEDEVLPLFEEFFE
jgi:hypothetical protein